MIGYGIREMIDAVRTGKVRTAMAVTTISIAMLIFTGFLLVSHNLSLGIDRFRSEGRIEVILADAADPGSVAALVHKIPGVAVVRPYTKEQAMVYFQEAHGADLARGIRDALGSSPFPPFLEVRLAATATDPEPVVERLRGLGGVAEVLYGRETAQRLSRLARLTRLITWTAGGLMSFFILLIVINSVRATVHARRADLYVLRLIGAADHTIRAPFLVEGAFLGILGAAIGLGLVAAAWAYIAARITFVPIVFLTPEMVGGSLVFALALGVLGGVIAVGEALRMKAPEE